MFTFSATNSSPRPSTDVATTSPPPPPYPSSSSRDTTPTKSSRNTLLASSTTTTTTVRTTTTTTHFWRRRSSAAIEDTLEIQTATEQSKTSAGLNVQHLLPKSGEGKLMDGTIVGRRAVTAASAPRPQSSLLLLDKELPQLPERPLPPIVFDASNQVDDPEELTFHEMLQRDTVLAKQDAAAAKQTGPSTILLPPAIVTITPSSPNPPSSSSSSGFPSSNAVSFVSQVRPSIDRNATLGIPDSAATIRRSRSFARDEDGEKKRKRRLSLGTGMGSFFKQGANAAVPASVADGKGKGKAKEVDALDTGTDQPEKALTRK
jgi:hypothetical protein